MLAPGKNYINGIVRLAVNYQDADGVDTDPTTVTLRIMSPSGVETTYVYLTGTAITKLDAGDYVCDFSPNQSGIWHWRWQTTGTNKVSAFEGQFKVQRSSFFDDVTDY